jgi:inosine/xanthosine triphosphate pyrophosphatase family protein
MEICIGSTNPAKVRQMMAALAPCGIQITAPKQSIILPAVNEDAADAIGNARKKAIAFAAVLDKNCLAMDASLRLPQFPLQTFVLRTVKHLHNAMGRPT